MSSARVSLLVPVYNRETLIGPCLDSLLAQTEPRLEIVVADNCSSDGTWQQVCGYAERDSRIRAVRNDRNLGPVGNWRRCAELATAPLAGLVFSDDVLDPEYVAELAPALDEPAIGFAASRPRIGSVAAATPIPLPACGSGRIGSRSYLHSALVRGDTAVSPGCALFRSEDLRRALAAELQVPTAAEIGRTGAGLDLWLYLDVAGRYPQVMLSEHCRVLFRDHAGSLTRLENPLVIRQYAEARLGYARRHLDAGWQARTAAAAWLAACRRGRRWLAPGGFLRQHGEVGRPGGFAAAVLELLAERLRAPARV